MKINLILFRLSVALLFISSMSIIYSLFITTGEGGNSLGVLIGGAVFWACLIGGYLLIIPISKNRKRFESDKPKTVHRRRRKPGALSFFVNQSGGLADLAMILFLILTLFFIIVPIGNHQVFAIICIAFLLFSIHMHCLLNGINYSFVKFLKSKENAG